MNPVKTIVIAGGTGLIGRALEKTLTSQGYTVFILTRELKTQHPNYLTWSPDANNFRHQQTPQELRSLFSKVDVVINLAGFSISKGRLNTRHLDKVLKSRKDSISALSHLINAYSTKAIHWLQASANGIYGHQGELTLNEASNPGGDALAKLCQEWEAFFLAQQLHRDVKRTITRFAMVMSPESLPWQRTHFATKFFVGGKLGSGRQWWSLIDLEELVKMTEYVISKGLEGIVNFSSPLTVRQADFGRELANQLKRPFIGHLPSWVLKIALGNLATYLLLNSCRVLPQKLLANGYVFKYSSIKELIRNNLST